jgi:hypothetical protein
LVTFEQRPLPEIPFWLPLARDARDAARFTVMLGFRAVKLIAHGGF